MQVTVVKNDGTTRECEIMLVRANPADAPTVLVDRMFGADGSETHDPIEAVEVDGSDCGLLKLEPGDRLTMRVDVGVPF